MIGALTTHLWQSTLFAVVAGLLTVAFRKNRAKVRYGLWLSASLKFFVPFALLMRLGSHLGWAPAAQRMATPAICRSRWSASPASPRHFRSLCRWRPPRPRPSIGSLIAILGGVGVRIRGDRADPPSGLAAHTGRRARKHTD